MPSAPAPRESLLTLQDALGPDAGLVLVGGAVRDRLLGRPEGDWDLATALPPQAVMDRARRTGWRVIPTGLQHGTVTVMLGDRPLEITTYRGDDGYEDGRRPVSVRLGVPLAEDLARRDFTINAMALPLEALDRPDWRELVVDPFGGQADLDARLLRAVGDPLRRFAEDGLRPLRACRFAAQLDFRVEAATRDAISQRLEVARKVSVERVLQELNKLLCGQNPGRGLELLEQTGLLDLWLGELRPLVGCGQNRHHDLDAWEHTRAVVDRSPADPLFRWAAFLHDAGKPGTRSLGPDGDIHFYGHEAHSCRLAKAILMRLKASRALVDGVVALIRHHGQRPGPEWSEGACRRLLARLAADGVSLEAWAALREADIQGRQAPKPEFMQAHQEALARLRRLSQAAPPLSPRALALDGAALVAILERPPGPWVGALQRHLLEIVLDEPASNSPEGLRALAVQWGADHPAGQG